MRKPILKNLKLNLPETKEVRSAMARQKSIKITINIDAKTLEKVRLIAGESGIPYQRLINRILNESLNNSETTESRLERVEKELKRLKKKLAA